MRRIGAGLVVLATVATAQAQVFKCKDAAGATVYSQTACTGGALIDSTRPRSPPAQARAPLTQHRELARAGEPPPPAAAVIPGQACPDAQAIRNMEVSAASRQLHAHERAVRAEQIRRAKACDTPMTDAQAQAMKADLREQARAARPAAPAARPGPTTCFLHGNVISNCH